MRSIQKNQAIMNAEISDSFEAMQARNRYMIATIEVLQAFFAIEKKIMKVGDEKLKSDALELKLSGYLRNPKKKNDNFIHDSLFFPQKLSFKGLSLKKDVISGQPINVYFDHETGREYVKGEDFEKVLDKIAPAKLRKTAEIVEFNIAKTCAEMQKRIHQQN